MGAKYSVSHDERWSFQGVELSAHAADRWAERMPDDSVAPETAFEQSVSVHDGVRTAFATGGHKPPENIRVFVGDSREGRYGAVFLIVRDGSGDVIVTTYRIQSRRDPSIRAYLWSRALEQGGVEF